MAAHDYETDDFVVQVVYSASLAVSSRFPHLEYLFRDIDVFVPPLATP